MILDARMQDASAQIDERSRIRSRMPWHRSSVAEKKETNEKILAISEYSDTVPYIHEQVA